MKLYTYQVWEGSIMRAEQASRELAEKYMEPNRIIKRVLRSVTSESIMYQVAKRQNQPIFI